MNFAEKSHERIFDVFQLALFLPLEPAQKRSYSSPFFDKCKQRSFLGLVELKCHAKYRDLISL